MDVTEIGAIASAASAVLALIEKYGPEAWATIKEAVETTKSTTGPTLAEIEAIYTRCKADNAAIQAS
ncbi:hypothetical protein IFJ82_06265 [Novacetimonas hansenii]|uniref:Uncharacterized protein n=1 Tax=Novacetimonas hansenii ATCC 23769 TaxID=714995 RepID=D5QGT3_NOVHA|nr:hypothetical protein [Novacetimonas hansenii]EFG83713.1 hypothetical protein GXY_11778 [Novacetimonas hansenii ATCC 23769]MBL7238305.1 hypothetical protein [Novacetimonas hansenii]PYD73381.1 hypothetical protein CFR74_04465 [Novacetimonas hansenii]QOF96179.1 hypothetical protein IFJ82_06265 [Novacetimonas hansenii]GBQ61706.1 hypothetical protein AA0243_2723 [Novacetimonas hansenii NRIC 0243]